MQNLVAKIILILAVLGLCIYAIIPPSGEKLPAAAS